MCKNKLINELISSGINITKEQSGKIFSYLKEPQINAEKHLISALQNEGSIKPDDIEIAAMHLLVRKWVKRIKNSNSVIDKANKHFEELLHGVEYEGPIHKPDEDWLEYFFDLVSKVSNETVQDIWSFLLIREHLENGSISKVLLNTLAMLDSKTANAFSTLCKLAYNLEIGGEERTIPLIIYDYDVNKIIKKTGQDQSIFDEYLEICPNELELEMLSEVGLITMNVIDREYAIYFPEESEAEFSCEGYTRIIKGVYNEEDDVYTVSTGYAFFTQIGLTLFNCIKGKQYENLPLILDGFIEAQI